MTRGGILYTVLYMSERTQIYLTDEQRRRLGEIAHVQGKSLAHVIREAVAVYIATAPVDAGHALDATFGTAPDMQVPSRDEWERA